MPFFTNNENDDDEDKPDSFGHFEGIRFSIVDEECLKKFHSLSTLENELSILSWPFG